jgi:heme exporter protein D
MEHYLAMGGYADFVWPAYAIAAFVMLALVVYARYDIRRQRRLLAALETHQGARPRAPARASGSQP